MAYQPYQYPGYPTYYQPPVPDQLAQLRQAQAQPQMIQQPVNIPQPVTGNIIWVQGEPGAKAYLVAAGNTVPLWDSENQVIYLKTVDASGVPSMRVLDYTERNQAQAPKQPPQIDLTQYITRDELEDILAERLKRPAKSTNKKEETDNG